MADITITKGPRGLFFVTDGEKNLSKGYKDEDEAKEALAAILAGNADTTDEPDDEDEAAQSDPGADDDAPAEVDPLQAVEGDLSDLDAEIERLRKIRDDKQAERDRIVVETGASENTPFPTLLQEFFAAQDRERMARVEQVEAAKQALGMAAGAGSSALDQSRAAPKRPAPRAPVIKKI